MLSGWRRTISVIAIASTMVLGICESYSTEIVLTVNSESDFVEKYNPHVNVAGHTRAGLMYLSKLKTIDINHLYLWPLNAQQIKEGFLCFTMSSRDGKYSAKWKISSKGSIKDLARIEMPTQYAEQISEYRPENLVATAAYGKQCRSKKMLYIPLSWGNSDGKSLVLYLNADSTETKLSVKLTNSKRTFDCNDILDEKNVAYDTACELRQLQLDGLQAIKVLRKNFDRKLPDIVLWFQE